MDKTTRQDIALSLYSQHLKRSIELKKDIWIYKILAAHSEVRNCLAFVEEALSTLDNSSLIFRKKKDAKKIAVWKKCHLLSGLYDYIKIAMEFKGDDKAVITTIHGSNNLPTHDMEQI